MILIVKSSAPEDLLMLQKDAAVKGLTPKEAYNELNKDTELKKRVRNSLVKEQGGLCAYCMCRIPRSDSGNQPPIIIEHFIARDPPDGRDVGQGLDYNNLLAVCHGNRGDAGTRTLKDLTCDAHRENREFKKINPMVAATLTSITYNLKGEINASDSDVADDLIMTLNLNCPTAPLLAERKAVLDSLINEIGGVSEEELVPYCTSILHNYLSETESKTPYVGVLLWYLKSLLEGLESNT